MSKSIITPTSIDPSEIAKFGRLAQQWWDPHGSLRTLHHINPCRLSFVTQYQNLTGTSVLDLGCGGGIFAEAMAREGADVTGVDANSEAIAVAKAHAEEQKLPINYLCSAVEKLKKKSFQVITCMEMLEHVDDPNLIIQHCARLLKPGGHLFLSTINRTLKAYLTAIIGAEYVLKLLPKQTHDYQRFIKPSELATSIRNAGLELIGLEGMDYNPFTHQAKLQASVDVNYLVVCQKPVTFATRYPD